MKSRNKYYIKLETINEESEGPDYHEAREYQVINKQTGAIVKRFSSVKDNGICYSYISGTKNVELSADGTSLLVTDEDDNVKQVAIEDEVQ